MRVVFATATATEAAQSQIHFRGHDMTRIRIIINDLAQKLTSSQMLIVRYLIALVFSVFMMATSLRIEERSKRSADYKISTPDRLVLQMQQRAEQGIQVRQLEKRRLVV
ncbi:hypothetical protein ACLKA6_000363 [Drosophila palustris]